MRKQGLTPGRAELDFVDANCCLGRLRVPGHKVFASADDLLREMDFVGIGEALVFRSLSRLY